MTDPAVADVLAGRSRYALIEGDCRDVLRAMPDRCVDALICDPPAGISFMSAKWDADRGGRAQWIAWLAEILGECRRVMKRGAHGLIWSLPRTSHWTGMAIEDAGLEVRDTIAHVQAQGWPKSRAHLKPAHETWWLCRAPLDGTVAHCVQTHGTGALQIDACRVATAGERPAREVTGDRRGFAGQAIGGSRAVGTTTEGRWPPNVVFSHSPACERVGAKRVRSVVGGKSRATTKHVFGEGVGGGDAYHAEEMPTKWVGTETVDDWRCDASCPVAQLDQESGTLRPGERPARRRGVGYMGCATGTEGSRVVLDKGGASRFFPVFPAAERDEAFPVFRYESKAPPSEREHGAHPTQKPLDLLRWMVRLICPPGGIVLDCFAGSGGTGVAALDEDLRCVLIEKDADYAAIARRRLAAASRQGSLFAAKGAP